MVLVLVLVQWLMIVYLPMQGWLQDDSPDGGDNGDDGDEGDGGGGGEDGFSDVGGASPDEGDGSDGSEHGDDVAIGDLDSAGSDVDEKLSALAAEGLGSALVALEPSGDEVTDFVSAAEEQITKELCASERDCYTTCLFQAQTCGLSGFASDIKARLAELQRRTHLMTHKDDLVTLRACALARAHDRKIERTAQMKEEEDIKRAKGEEQRLLILPQAEKMKAKQALLDSQANIRREELQEKTRSAAAKRLELITHNNCATYVCRRLLQAWCGCSGRETLTFFTLSF